MSDRDIVDEIDDLVDWQLSKVRTGYDWSVGEPDCPHPWCGEKFHGLPIKQHMRDMRGRGQVDAGYRYSDDDSVVLCPGSTFEGEFEPPAPVARERPTWQQMVDEAMGSGRTLPASFMDMAEVDRLSRLRAFIPVRREQWNPDDAMLVGYVSEFFLVEARRQFWRLHLHADDLQFTPCEETRDDLMRGVVRIEVRWAPDVDTVTLHGGPGDGQRIQIRNPRDAEYCVARPMSLSDFRLHPSESVPDFDDRVLRYRCAGWNMAARCWVYSLPA